VNIHDVYGKILPHFRVKRMNLFVKLLRPTDKTKILDVGGYEGCWSLLPIKPQITLLNIDTKKNEVKGRFTYVQGDGRKLPYGDKSFDIVYSNSVIEHVGTLDDQQAFAKEIARVGKSFFVQTPNKNFFIEPHYIAPFIHFLPKSVRVKLARHFTLWGLIAKPNSAQIKEMVESISLLDKQEMAKLFPKSTILAENFLFFPKSILAFYTGEEN